MKIDRVYELTCQSAKTHADLANVLQHAFSLEHATLHPYFTAILSLKPGTNTEIEQEIRWVSMEEMLHMCIVSNLIVALGGKPDIANPKRLPSYPGPLPMGVGDDLIISLKAYSPEQVQQAFMGIEYPEDPIEIDRKDVPDEQAHSTIGRFYRLLGETIKKIGGPLPGNVDHQVTTLDPYHADELFAIKTIDDALRATHLIVHQGEGTTSKPTDPDGGMAHYYRFQQLVVGRRLVKDPSAPEGYSFTGDEIPYSPDDVWPIAADTRLADLPAGSDAHQKGEAFARQYTKVMKTLQATYDGKPDTIHDAVDDMRELQKVGYEVCATPYPGRDGVNVGPTWEWID